ncbi:methyl-accepting chemotaxis protein [Colwellia sp. E2M01]|uniref:methyl-accepting chemotaxis protein n=1 Tax=Colwellia sp. E2M01 TaxID=2841561 RepID=UPI001C085FD8|nr:methyl-accepting chemotaxis protein [Colwellia sp. E2M01]MBU2870591.1 methyl-accepting chemotaxis protein [Colwellia sp. E2M01]
MFDNLSIKIKYSIPLAIALISLIAITIANYSLSEKLESNAKIFPNRFMPAINAVLNADRDLYQTRVAEIQLASSSTSTFVAEINENAKQAKDRFNQYRDLMKEYPDVINSLNRFDSLYSEWFNEVKKVISASQSGDTDMALLIMQGSSKTAFANLRKLYDVAGESAFNKASLLQDEIAKANSASKTVSLTVAILIIIITTGAAFYSQRLLLQRLDEIKKGINEITSGGGDLTNKIQIQQHDEIGDLGTAFNQFVESLRGLISEVRNEVSELSSSSTTLKEYANKGLDVADKQNSASDMIVSAVHEMSMATKELANIALKTADETKDAMSCSEEGVTKIASSVTQVEQLYITIENASEGTKKLSEDSQNISGVLDVIRGIAEQTNLLALNAAIEAARAGEQGRGFAVVADEVRNLAQKTQESTDSIQSMIESLQSGVNSVVNFIDDGFAKVTNTVELSKETESSLQRILSSIITVSDMSIQTATATEEQTAVTDEINRNLHSLNEQIVLSKDISADTNDASMQIQQLAKNIEGGVGRFKV